LSIPGIYEDVKRPEKVEVRYRDLNFDWKEETLTGMEARIFQHEYDHLQGILFKKHETTVKPYLKPSCIIITGPFCISRNPMYLGMLLILAGTAILLKSVFLLFPSLLFVLVMEGFYIRKEEFYLTEQFGKDFLKYKRKVRRWL